MTLLFKIETDKAILTWNQVQRSSPTPTWTVEPIPGSLVIRPRRDGLRFGKETWRGGVPEAVAHDPGETSGPRIYEQTDYRLFVQSKSDAVVSISHRDPLIQSDLSKENDGRIQHGHVNFGSEVGHTIFTVLVGSRPEFDFEIEVFPTKVDYRSDYEQLLAEVQDILTGLALEYLQSTFQLGFGLKVPQPSHIEWLTLLRHIASDLERALYQIARRPVRALTRETMVVRAERIRQVDSSMLSAIRRGTGSGSQLELRDGLSVRERLPANHPRQTLDTPEHRWLRNQLERIRRRLGILRQEEQAGRASDRRETVLHELDTLEGRLARLQGLQPIAAAEGTAPAGFASLQLMAAPGYREAYRACLVLSLGLRIEGGPLHLSVKRISLLYEYWCYLALLRLLTSVTGTEAHFEELFSIRQHGLHVMLEKGHRTTIPFEMEAGRKVSLTYSPSFQGGQYLIPQRPDLLITFEDPHWRGLHLLLDAKYRVEASDEYTSRYGTPGPPQDALNVLHRYRDAILEADRDTLEDEQPRHTVVQAAAAFPYRERYAGEFQNTRLWRALCRLGVGAIPLLPGSIEYLEQWVRTCLRRGGWALADRAIGHRAREQARDWRIAASEPVLIGVLRGEYEEEQLNWIVGNRMYYMPRYRTQRRQFAAKWVAIYSPSALRDPGAVTHYAAVRAVDVLRRGDLTTPWPSRGQDSDRLYVVYELGEVRELDHPVENPGPDVSGQRFSTHRWTSRLGLDRARRVSELTLETEPEWRLYEDLRASNTAFALEPGRVRMVDPDDPAGRTWFVVQDGPRIRYAGASGFLIRGSTGEESYLPRVEKVLERIDNLTGR